MVRLASVGDAGKLAPQCRVQRQGQDYGRKHSRLASTNRRGLSSLTARTARRLRLRSAEKIVLLRRIYARDNQRSMSVPSIAGGSRAGNADLRAGILQKNIPAPQLRAVDGQR